MKRAALLLGLVLACLPVTLAQAEPAPTIRWVEFGHSVNPISIHRIVDAIEEAEVAGHEMVIVRLDTPGGMVVSLHETVQAMLNADVPVVVWVAPSGAHAASAGFFMLIAADVAVMSPGTRTGAASTVFSGGENRDDDPMLRKMNEDGAALLRSIAERRGRDKEACEEAVFAAKAFEESVALEKGLIDFVANDREDLLAQLDGREVRMFDGEVRTLRTAGAQIVEINVDAKQKFFEFLARPEIAYLLLVVGGFLVYFEFQNPGLFVPGIVGALLLVLFAISAMSLPISILGGLLIVLSLVLFILEIKIVSHGLLTVGGIAALIAGSLLLIDGPIPELRVSPWLVTPVSITLGLTAAWMMRKALQAQAQQVTTGVEGLLHEIGVVTHPLDPVGKVFVRGEIWNARVNGGTLDDGTPIRVTEVDDLMITVEAAETEQPEGESS